VFIVQSTFPPSDNLFELLLMVDAAKRASAKRIVAVMPYFGFARQDRKDKPRVSASAPSWWPICSPPPGWTGS
jgi:ribose-phosphate pyrophosphokinase